MKEFIVLSDHEHIIKAELYVLEDGILEFYVKIKDTGDFHINNLLCIARFKKWDYIKNLS